MHLFTLVLALCLCEVNSARLGHTQPHIYSRQNNECVTVNSPNYYSPQYVTDVSGVTRLDFEVKADSHAIISLSAQPNDLPDMYRILLGAGYMSSSLIRRRYEGEAMVQVWTPGILSPSEFRKFWVTWDSGIIRVGKSGENTPFMEWTDPNPLAVNFAGYATNFGSTGVFQICTANVGGGHGDPHMTTFDGLKYNFQGYCTYVLVKNCDSQGKFEITADVRGRREPTKPPTRMVAINISAIGIPTIRLLEDNSFMIGGKLHRGSNFHSELASVISSRDNVIARLSKPKLSVIWNGKPHKVQVVLNGRELAGTVCGLLGNADGDTTNDFIKPDGDPASSAEEFGNSWAVKNSCP